VPVRWLAVCAGVLALGVSGLFGGLDKVGQAKVPAVAVSAPNEGVPWNVTVLGVYLQGDLPPLRLEHDGDHWVEVLATVEVTAEESLHLTDVLRLGGVDGLVGTDGPDGIEPAEIYLSRDATRAIFLHPGMPEKLGFFWEQAASAPIPSTVDVLIQGKTHRLDTLTGHLEWLDPATRATVRVRVKDQRT
jgi:hypothetical protein